MSRSFFFLIFLPVLVACDTASNIKRPDKNYFLKYFGGEGNQVAKDLIVNPDGTFYILGNSTQTTSSNTKVYIAKVDAFGNVIKQITYGTFPMEAKDFELTSDGRLAVVANRKSATNDVLLSRFSLDLNLIDSAVLSVGPSSYSNSLTGLKDGGFIIEGYKGDPTTQSVEMHIRVDKSLQRFAGPGGWTDTSKAVTATVYAGVKTIQQNATTFYTFGYTNAFYTSTNKKFWAYSFGYNGSPINNGDLSVFESAGGTADKIVTCAIKAAVGGYLVVGITNPQSNFSLKASIINDTVFSFLSSGVFQDKILLSNLGQGPTPYATAFSAISHNLLLANAYNIPSSSSDILLMKIDNALVPLWGSPVQFGGSGEDTAAAVSELPDGHIIVLGTMQLGNPPEQFKMVLMKLNANGHLEP